jgi:hypothetical protein
MVNSELSNAAQECAQDLPIVFESLFGARVAKSQPIIPTQTSCMRL